MDISGKSRLGGLIKLERWCKNLAYSVLPDTEPLELAELTLEPLPAPAESLEFAIWYTELWEKRPSKVDPATQDYMQCHASYKLKYGAEHAAEMREQIEMVS